MTSRRVLAVSALVLFVAGLGVMFYPNISAEVQHRAMSGSIEDYRARTQSQDVDLLEDLYQQMVAHNVQLAATGQAGLVDPFSYEQPSFNLAEFGLAENVVGYLDVPKMGVHAPIYLGASVENMAVGAAHLSQTSLPVGGPDTNAVIAGHRNRAMFWFIDRLVAGDEVTVTNFHDVLRYRVVESAVIQPDDIATVLIQPGRDLITLISCTPIGKNSQRIVVYAERVT